MVEADLWDQLPADVPALLALLPRADLYLQDELQFAFHPTSRASGEASVDVGNAWSRRLEIIARSTALACWTGAMAGRVAGSLQDAPLMCNVAQVRVAVARSKQRGRVAIVIADNLKTHTAAGSLLVRSLLSDFKDQLYLVYSPAYDPDANRIEWLWRISRRIVTHNHHRSTFELLLTDVEKHFQALARTPAEVLRHIGSPFAPDKDQDAPLSLA